MISLKRYLDSQSGTTGAGLLSSMLCAYQSALTAMGISAVQACPSAGPDLQRQLISLGKTLGDADATDPDLIARTEGLVSQQLQQFGNLAQADLQQKTDDVKALLVVLTRTASAIASTDKHCARRFDEFRARLEGIATLDSKPVLHGDNGSTLKATTVLAMLNWLGVKPSLAARHELYIRAREINPARWSGRTRNWSPIGAVTLNPERDSIVHTHSRASDIQPLAA